jgi:uncharacterized protein
MRIAVVGGSGFIGKHLIKRLTERGDNVMLFTRTAPPVPKDRVDWSYKLKPLETIFWTPEKPEKKWVEALEVADCVINLAGRGIMDERWTPEFLEDCTKSRVQTTEAIGKVLTNGKARSTIWINASAIGIYGFDTGPEALDETSPEGNDVLAQMCTAWEKATAPAQKHGIRVLHARIGLVMGPHGGMLAKMMPMFKTFLGGPIGSGKQYLSWIHIDDVARSFMHMIDHKTFAGPFNVTAPEPVTMKEFAAELGASLHKPALIPVPAWALKLGLGERSQAVLGGQRVTPRRLQETEYSFRFETVKAALEDVVLETEKDELAARKEKYKT